MIDIRPFPCIRPAKGRESEIAALPYDVYSRAEAREAVKGKSLSFLRIDRPETQFPEDADMYGEEVYEKAHELLVDMLDDGDFIQDEERAYYLYELTRDGRSQTGVVGCASIDDYLESRIKEHENTREDKERDRVRHVAACNAQTGPVFLVYKENNRIERVVEAVKREQPLFSFVSEDGIRHRGWKVSGLVRVGELRSAFEAMDTLYIADGHHRAASAVKVGLRKREEHPDYTGAEEFNFFLSVLFPEEELLILDYNRVVKDLNGFTEEEFLKKVQEKFILEELTGAARPEKKGSFTMFLKDSWYGLTAKEEVLSDDVVEGLDVSLLQRELLHPILGIGDPRTDERIAFVGGVRGLEELERRVHTDMKVAFALYPTSIQELFAVADKGLRMPPKSTWFEPKLRSGLFIHALTKEL